MLTKYRFLILFFAVFIGMPLVYSAEQSAKLRYQNWELYAHQIEWCRRLDILNCHMKSNESRNIELTSCSKLLLEFYSDELAYFQISLKQVVNREFYRVPNILTIDFPRTPRWKLPRSFSRLQQRGLNMRLSYIDQEITYLDGLEYSYPANSSEEHERLKKLNMLYRRKSENLKTRVRAKADNIDRAVEDFKRGLEKNILFIAKCQAALMLDCNVDIDSEYHYRYFCHFRWIKSLERIKDMLWVTQEKIDRATRWGKGPDIIQGLMKKKQYLRCCQKDLETRKIFTLKVFQFPLRTMRRGTIVTWRSLMPPPRLASSLVKDTKSQLQGWYEEQLQPPYRRRRVSHYATACTAVVAAGVVWW